MIVFQDGPHKRTLDDSVADMSLKELETHFKGILDYKALHKHLKTLKVKTKPVKKVVEKPKEEK